MIDYIKVLIRGGNISKLRSNENLEFFSEVNLTTGEIKTMDKKGMKITTKEQAYYQGLKFTIHASGKIFISGSLHKYWNKGEHNYNDFSLDAIIEVLTDIRQKFDISPHQMKINALEIGVNIIPPIKTIEILKSCFLHSTKEFKWVSVRDEGRYIQAEHSQYVVKIYDKARHYKAKGFPIINEIIRFEIKYMKMEKLKKHNIQTIQDILDFGLENFVPMLAKEWSKILFYDYTIKSNCKALPNYCNPYYWKDLTCRRSAFNKHRIILSELIRDSSENISKKIKEQITTKGHDLVIRGVQIDPLYIWSKRIPPKLNQTCCITGLDISMQKPNSKLLSHTGLYFYKKNHPEIFKNLKRKYLSDYWNDSDLKMQIQELAHNIRNRKNNLTLSQKRLYPPNQYRLFSVV